MKGLYSPLTEGLQGLGDLKPHTKEVLITYLYNRIGRRLLDDRVIFCLNVQK